MKQLQHYLGIVFLLSIPLWILGYFFDTTKTIPIKLPVSALQFLCVLLTVVIITKRNGNSASSILLRGFDFRQIKVKPLRFAVFILMPLIVFFSYFIMRWNGIELPTHLTPIWNIPVLLIIYGISGYCEELGWTGMATDELLLKFNAISTGLIVGIVWAIWHIIPYTQAHNPAIWIFWQCIFTIVFRILITKIYLLTNRSIFATIALHTTYNTAVSVMPYYGSSYNPIYMTIATCIVGMIVFISFEKVIGVNKV